MLGYALLEAYGETGEPRALAAGTLIANELLARTASLWNMYGPTETTVWSTVH